MPGDDKDIEHGDITCWQDVQTTACNICKRNAITLVFDTQSPDPLIRTKKAVHFNTDLLRQARNTED